MVVGMEKKWGAGFFKPQVSRKAGAGLERMHACVVIIMVVCVFENGERELHARN